MMNTKQKPMRSVWQSLLWKEWHEHKWKLVGLVLFMLVSSVVFGRGDMRMMPVGVSSFLFFYSLLAGLFIGMYTAAGENGRGTMPFLQTLPVAMRKPAAFKLLMSWFTVVIPVLVLIGWTFAYLSWLGIDEAQIADAVERTRHIGVLQAWGFNHWLLGIGLSGVLLVSSLLLWMVAAGVNRSDEIRAGALGFLTIAVIWFCLISLAVRAEKSDLPSLEQGTFLVMATAPGGPGFIGAFQEMIGSPVPLINIAVLGHAGLLAWYLRRFGRKAVRPARTLGGRVKATKSDWLAPPRRSQLTAIIWKQVHETGPLALMAAAAVLVMASLAFWLNKENAIQNSFTEILVGITVFVGFLVTVVTGQGVFLEDVKPKVGIFWRSRPVNSTHWFFVKFFTGLTVLVVTFGALFLIAYAFDTGRPYLRSDHLGVQVAFTVMFFLLIYTLSMASYCLGRQPILSVVATIGILYCGSFAFAYGYWTVFDQGPHWSVGLTTLIVAQVAATAVAWLAVRNDWGWHR